MSQPAIAPDIRTLAALRASGYRPRTVKDELRANAALRLRAGDELFPGIRGYDETVIPQIARGLLSRHDILLLGLRGQAKTRLLRGMVHLLDEWIPVIGADPAGQSLVELPDDPMRPVTRAGKRTVETMGDETPIRWMHRSERYHEKLATPDVTIADLIGEIDLVKHAEGRYLADEQTMHFGLIPRASRGIFVINELPDLAPRIQVGLFNVLEERDIQIRGYPVRLDIDTCLMFSANPEDYTNRGRIVTPLKDRIGTVVRTHYPTDMAVAMQITSENAFENRSEGGDDAFAPIVEVPPIMRALVEATIAEARGSQHVNQSSGVSARASIAVIENLISAAESRGLVSGEERVGARVSDMGGLAASLRGKIELMLTEDTAGADGKSTEDRLIEAFFGEAVKEILGNVIDLEDVEHIAEAFQSGLRLDLGHEVAAVDVVAGMEHVDGLLDAARRLAGRFEMDEADPQQLACCGELVLEFLYVNNRLSKIVGAGSGGGVYAR